jgi:microcystin-dependent protein
VREYALQVATLFFVEFLPSVWAAFLWRKLMPFDSEGNFTRVHNWESDRQAEIDIESDRHDEEDDNFANGFNDCMLRDGRATMQGDLKMGNFQVKQVAKGTVSTDAVNKSQLDSATSSLDNALTALMNKLWKVGDIKASVKNANHDNWFLCNGQAISRVTYSELFALIGVKFGAGDGTATFNLPDYRGKFLRGLGGNSAGDIYTTQAESLPNITGTFAGGVGDNATSTGAFKRSGTDSKSTKVDAVGDSNALAGLFNFSASNSNSIYNGTHVTPINQAVNYFIKVKLEA